MLSVRSGWRDMAGYMEDAARAGGTDAAFDMHTRLFGTTYLKTILPPWALEGGTDDIARRLGDPTERQSNTNSEIFRRNHFLASVPQADSRQLGARPPILPPISQSDSLCHPAFQVPVRISCGGLERLKSSETVPGSPASGHDAPECASRGQED